MSIQDRFLEYVAAFEITYIDNNWSRLEPYFSEQANYDSGLGEVAHGLPAVMAKNKESIST